MAEQNNELLMKNHESRPSGSEPFLEVNAISPKPLDIDEEVVADVVMEGIFDTMELMVVIIQIPKKGKSRGTTKSGIIPR